MWFVLGSVVAAIALFLIVDPIHLWRADPNQFTEAEMQEAHDSIEARWGTGRSSPAAGASGTSAAAGGQGTDLNSVVMGRWCGDGGSTSTFGANAAWTNYNPTQGSQPGTWQIIGRDRLILRQNGAVATMRFTVAGNSLTLTDTARGGAPMTITRC
jgi:hypothetical protein